MFKDTDAPELTRLRYAFLDQHELDSGSVCNEDEENEDSLENCKLLNKAPAYFDGGYGVICLAPAEI